MIASLLLITAIAQPPDVPGKSLPPMVPGFVDQDQGVKKEPTQTPPMEITVEQPKVVFVGVKQRDVTGTETLRDDTWHPYSAVIVYPKGHGNGTELRASATDTDIRVAAGLEVRRMATPFDKSLRPGEVRTVDDDFTANGRLAFLRDLVPYTTATQTQVSGRRWSGVISAHSRDALELKWRVPGGMVNVHGWSSVLLKSRGTTPTVELVRQDENDHSSAITWGRTYPDGTVFADVLRNATGTVFEVRVAEKNLGRWDRYIAYRNTTARPFGYRLLRSNDCAECHNQAGVGAYAGAAIPGGDSVLSDPYDVLERGESVQGGYGLSLSGAEQSIGTGVNYSQGTPARARPLLRRR